MTREGSNIGGLLRGLHGSECAGQEYSTCRPVPNVRARDDPDETPFYVLYMAWCGECGAAEWDFIG